MISLIGYLVNEPFGFKNTSTLKYKFIRTISTRKFNVLVWIKSKDFVKKFQNKFNVILSKYI